MLMHKANKINCMQLQSNSSLLVLRMGMCVCMSEWVCSLTISIIWRILWCLFWLWRAEKEEKELNVNYIKENNLCYGDVNKICIVFSFFCSHSFFGNNYSNTTTKCGLGNGNAIKAIYRCPINDHLWFYYWNCLVLRLKRLTSSDDRPSENTTDTYNEWIFYS